MALLLKHIAKKVKASTLVETIVASIIIIVIFAIASLTLNNIFKTTVVNTNANIEAELNKLYYLYEHNKINETYTDDFNGWEISITKQTLNKNSDKIIEAKNLKTNKIVVKTVPNETIQ